MVLKSRPVRGLHVRIVAKRQARLAICRPTLHGAAAQRAFHFLLRRGRIKTCWGQIVTNFSDTRKARFNDTARWNGVRHFLKKPTINDKPNVVQLNSRIWDSERKKKSNTPTATTSLTHRTYKTNTACTWQVWRCILSQWMVVDSGVASKVVAPTLEETDVRRPHGQRNSNPCGSMVCVDTKKDSQDRTLSRTTCVTCSAAFCNYTWSNLPSSCDPSWLWSFCGASCLDMPPDCTKRTMMNHPAGITNP